MALEVYEGVLFRGSFDGKCPSKPNGKPKNVLEGSRKPEAGTWCLGDGVSCRNSLPSLRDCDPRPVDLDPSAMWGSEGLEMGSVG